MTTADGQLTSIEICAGAGGQAVGLHAAGFRHLALVEIDKHAAATLRLNLKNRTEWAWERSHCQVFERDVKHFHPLKEIPNPELLHVVEKPKRTAQKKPKNQVPEFIQPGMLDLLAGGVPCPPFSAAGKQLGMDDDRDLFPRMLELVDDLRPKAVMIENVRGIFDAKFDQYRAHILDSLWRLGYGLCGWKLLHAEDFEVPQLRPRAILVAIRDDCYRGFDWPEPSDVRVSVGEALGESMAKRLGAKSPRYREWHSHAVKGVAPTLVGGSKKHGGADLGPTRAKKAWDALGVDGMGVANDPGLMVDKERDLGRRVQREDGRKYSGPKLTVTQASIIQGFPEEWEFEGGKTARYRQVGNAFPPPVARAVGSAIAEALGRKGDVLPRPRMGYPKDPKPGLF
ncbi:DNA (cytosine-5-)-methyltransferase [Streptomyces sp. NPDC050095]|uniref:DNA cytosine methyltransferase n=1 Tax=unclassified Streptomyces TaxID=2593676 RepID=UPI00344544A2